MYSYVSSTQQPNCRLPPASNDAVTAARRRNATHDACRVNEPADLAQQSLQTVEIEARLVEWGDTAHPTPRGALGPCRVVRRSRRSSHEDEARVATMCLGCSVCRSGSRGSLGRSRGIPHLGKGRFRMFYGWIQKAPEPGASPWTQRGHSSLCFALRSQYPLNIDANSSTR